MRFQVRYVLVLAVLVFMGGATVRADDWPQWLGPQRDGIWRETGLLEKFPKGGPKVVWRAQVDGVYAAPAVADGRVFVPVYVCTGDKSPNPGQRNELKGTERLLCLRASDGKLLWKHEYPCTYKISYPDGPRCMPTVHGGKVYT